MRGMIIITSCMLALLSSGCAFIMKGNAKNVAGLTVVETKLKALEKPEDPPAEMVEVPFVPSPSDGQSTVVVNVRNADAKVSLVTSTKRSAINVEGKGQVAGGGLQNVDLDTRLLCARTPCAFTLPFGSATLHIESPPKDGWESSTDLYDIDVLPEKAQLVTHVMSRAKTETVSPSRKTKGLFAAILLETFGWTGVTVGGTIALVGEPGPGLGVAVGGALLVALGVMVYDPGSKQIDERSFHPSATTLSPYPPR